MIVAGLFVIGAATLGIKGSGLKTYAMCKISAGYWERMSGPEVVGTWPSDGEGNIKPTATLKASLKNPNGDLDPRSITPASVAVVRTRDQQPVVCTVTAEHGSALLT
ncbi:MAG: hypothetical protein H0U59_01105, partial [Gemmatimonadaceae bacterium]|nr:hypothetical protein [Gemmatimonadaceae bacterium]